MTPIPALTTAQMIEVDRAMLEDYHISLVQMMENAGRALARLARERFLEGDPRGKRVVILAGAGGNGGGALVGARHLHNWGASVSVRLAKPAGAFGGVPALQLDALARMGVELAGPQEPPPGGPFDLLLDGLIGYSLGGPPRGAFEELIRWANAAGAPLLSLDLPSGLDATTGQTPGAAIRAAATLSLALPKTGLLAAGAGEFSGELFLADISVPPGLYQKAFGLAVPPLFARNEIIRVDG